MNNDSGIAYTEMFPYTDLDILSSDNNKYHALFVNTNRNPSSSFSSRMLSHEIIPMIIIVKA